MKKTFKNQYGSPHRIEIAVRDGGVHVLAIASPDVKAGAVLTPGIARELGRAILQEVDRLDRSEMLRRNLHAIKKEIARAESDARFEAEVAARIKAVSEKRRAERATLDADAWELFKAINPDTRRKSFDKVNPRVVEDFRRAARCARELAEARAE